MFHNKCKLALDIQKDALNQQAVKLAEKESDLKTCYQKLYFAEGQIKSLQDLVDTMRKQLEAETKRALKLESIVLQGYQTTQEKFEEQLSNMYAEDPDIVLKMHEEFCGQEGEL